VWDLATQLTQPMIIPVYYSIPLPSSCPSGNVGALLTPPSLTHLLSAVVLQEPWLVTHAILSCLTNHAHATGMAARTGASVGAAAGPQAEAVLTQPLLVSCLRITKF